MTIPYRTRKLLKNVATVLLILLLAALLVTGIWVLWLEAYIVFDRDQGASLDMSLPRRVPTGQVAVLPEEETVSIYYNEGDNAINTSKELAQLVGYYVERDALKDLGTVRSQIQALPAGTPILIDVKNVYGSAYYSSMVVGQQSGEIDIAAMDELIAYLNKSGMYVIARLPALCDKYYGLNHVPDGLYHSSRGYLWMDDNGCYWLNPESQGTITYLVQIVNELKSLGFDEVVFDNFYVPDAKVYFPNDRTQALATAAQTLVTTCATDTFAVSFVGQDGAFPIPEGRSRLYLTGAAAANAANIASQTGLEDPSIRLVFLTDVHDTRFDVYSVLRPLSAAH